MLSLSQDEIERARGQVRGAFKNLKTLDRFQPFTLKIDVGREALDQYLASQMELVGVDVVATPHRNYRYASFGGHLIGYMNEAGPDELTQLNDDVLRTGSGQGAYRLGDYVGRRGLERKFERDLRGRGGKERGPVDAQGRRKDDADQLIPAALRLERSQPGKNLVLSRDWRLQELAEKTFPATAGTD